MKERPIVWIFLVLLGVGLTWFIARHHLSKTPISLTSVETSRGSNGCHVIVSVDRRDRWIGLSHGEPPSLERAWLSDGQGHELSSDFLSPLTLPARDSLESWQFGWRIAQTIPHSPKTVFFHVTFTAAGTQPFKFEQELRNSIDFNYRDE